MRLAALAGGVGAAKLLSGLVRILPPEDISVIVNTGDDFRWLGLQICPDLDTITYTLAGLDNPATGWGVRDETFRCLERLDSLGCDTWFQVGDRDLATHIYRTHALQSGATLSAATDAIARAHGIQSRILPMTDTPAPTIVHTTEGSLAFQDYFVRRQCSPEVRGFSFQGIENAAPAPGVLEAIRDADVVVVCPSNLYISIGPILAVPGLRAALAVSPATVIAVTPIVAGAAIKGPAGAMMRQLGCAVSPATVAGLYRDFLDIFVLDLQDEGVSTQIAGPALRVCMADTIMNTMESRVSLAQFLLDISA